MKKILPIAIVGILVLSGLGAVGISNDITITTNNDNDFAVNAKSASVSFSQVLIEEKDSQFVEVNLENVATYVSEPGCPMVPKVIEHFELPFGAKNIEVKVTVNNVQELDVVKRISPAPAHIPLIAGDIEVPIENKINEEIYSSEEPYPAVWNTVQIGSGLNSKMERVCHVNVPIHAVRYIPKTNKILVPESADIEITYDAPESSPSPAGEEYDMVIIAPLRFKLALGKLVRHKNNNGIKTFVKTTNSIYREFEDGVDKPEQIKMFIEHAINEHGVTYVLLVGGLKNIFWNKPQEHTNYGAKWWHVPVRYTNFYDNPAYPLSAEKLHDPGFCCDLYYADVFNGSGQFDDWDPNGDGIIAAWGREDDGIQNDTIAELGKGIDFFPDVALGRLACRNVLEVRNVVNKIVNYERNAYDSDWFTRAVAISGDGFMDQVDLDIQWNTTELPDGEYTIFAQAKADNGSFGIADKIKITIDRTKETYITANHDDYLRISDLADDGKTRIYSFPMDPIAEIVSISEGNILGYNDNASNTSESIAYCNTFTGWGNVNFTDGILHIRGKSYDPRPYGVETDIRVWVINETQDIVFEEWYYGNEMYFEGEWGVGERTLNGKGGGFYYLPDDFETDMWLASNGRYSDGDDMLEALNPGCGFAFISGHGSPNTWCDHFPGIPGNRAKGSTKGLGVLGIPPDRIFPLNHLKNINKLPIFIIGGCHNSQFNVSMIPGFLDKHNEMNTWCHGFPVPECYSWYLVKMRGKGAIASIGNTGLGYGVPGEAILTEGLDVGICALFFNEYSQLYNENRASKVYLGDVYANALTNYTLEYNVVGMLDHAKTLGQWVLLGDPSLRIGGIP